MKKSLLILFLVFILISNIFLISLINAQEPPSLPAGDSSEKSVEKFNEVSSNMVSSEDRNPYLKQEWTKILKNGKTLGPIFGPVISFYDKVAVVFNPIFGFLSGISPPALSWLFVLSIIVWFTILILLYRILCIFSPNNKSYPAVISLVSLIVLSFFKIPKWIAETIVNKISGFKTIWLQIAIISFVIILLFLIMYFSKLAKKFSKDAKEQAKKDQEEMDMEKIHQKAEIVDQIGKGVAQ